MFILIILKYNYILTIFALIYFIVQSLIDSNSCVDTVIGSIILILCWINLVFAIFVKKSSLNAIFSSLIAYAIIYNAHIQEDVHFVLAKKDENASMDAIYFSIVTASTVGYGDIYPVSRSMRLLTMSQILFSTLIIGYLFNANL